MKNLLANYAQTLDDMALVESIDYFGRIDPGSGDYWKARQTKDNGHTVASALKKLSKLYKYDSATVYGVGGWNRWLVSPNGEVALSGYHSLARTKKAAEELGFAI